MPVEGPSRKVQPGENLVPGRLYRITEIDTTDPDHPLKVGDLLRCDYQRPGCVAPEFKRESQVTGWAADFDPQQDNYRTLISGLELCGQVASGTDLTPGRYYRITEIDPHDPDPSLKVGDVVLCAVATPGCIDPESMVSDGMGCEWFADYDPDEEAFRTLVNGAEEVEAPT